MMNAARPTISIILTTCDRPELLRRAYSYVLEATSNSVASNIELIVVNDGKYPCIIEASTQSKLVVRLISRGYDERIGVARARNLGIDLAQGEYLLFLDDDDFLEPYAIDALLLKAREEQLDLVYGNIRYVTETRSLVEEESKDISVEDHNFTKLQLVNYIAISSYIIRRDVLVEGFDPYLDSHEDWAFLLANCRNIKHGCVHEIVSNITFCPDRTHRNLQPDDNQRLLRIFKTIYARYPSKEMQQQRDEFLAEWWQDDNAEARPLEIIDCGQMSLLVINPQETIQNNLLIHQNFEYFIPCLAADLLNHAKIAGDVLDVGAAIGSFAIALSGLLNNARKVHCFECQKSVFLHLCSNILINHQWENIEPYLQALADDAREIQVPQLDPFEEKYTGSVSLRGDVIAIRKALSEVAEPTQGCEQFCAMQTLTIDQLFSHHEIALIKIDAEGMETMILSGAQAVISGNRPFIITESWALEEFAAIREELYALFHGLNYRIFLRQDDLVAIPVERLNSDIKQICNQHKFQ